MGGTGQMRKRAGQKSPSERATAGMKKARRDDLAVRSCGNEGAAEDSKKEVEFSRLSL